MVSIDGYPIDLFEKEDHNFEMDITDHPVEQGSDITDHVIEKPGVLELMGIVSDTPIGTVATDPSRRTELLPSQDAYQRLQAIKSARKTVVVVTSLGTFKNMILQKLGVPRESKTLKALVFNVTLREVRIIANRRVTVAVPNSGTKQNLGHKESKLWADKFKIGGDGAIFVVRLAAGNRDVYIKSWGEQPTMVTSEMVNGVKRPYTGTDVFFEIVGAATPNGYVKDGTFNPFHPAGSATISSLPSNFSNVGPNPLTYNYGDKTWHDKTGKSVTKTMAPDATPEGFTPQQWRDRVQDHQNSTAVQMGFP